MTNKYHVAPPSARTMDGIRFDSKAEMRRYRELLLLQRAGQISNLELQPQYQLVDPFTTAAGKFRGIKYIGDFRYFEGGHVVVEDCKGVRTQVYKIKKQLLLKRYQDIDFREVKS